MIFGKRYKLRRYAASTAVMERTATFESGSRPSAREESSPEAFAIEARFLPGKASHSKAGGGRALQIGSDHGDLRSQNGAYLFPFSRSDQSVQFNIRSLQLDGPLGSGESGNRPKRLQCGQWRAPPCRSTRTGARRWILRNDLESGSPERRQGGTRGSTGRSRTDPGRAGSAPDHDFSVETRS